MKKNARNKLDSGLPSFHERSSRNKKPLVFILQISALLFCVSIIILSSVLIIKTLSGKDDIPQKEATLSTNASATSTHAENTTPAPSTTMETMPPTPTPKPERLSSSPIVESFFGPLPVAETPEELKDFEARAIYIAAAAYVDRSIELTANSEINTFVIDLKEYNGIRFDTKNPLALELEAKNPFSDSYDYISDQYSSYGGLKGFIDKCHENGIKVIGRIVCFKDPLLASIYPERSIQDINGNSLEYVMEDTRPFPSFFADPYHQENWNYNIDLAIEAVEAGIDEIQFDYIRFPTGDTKSREKSYFGEPDTIPTRVEAINRFLQTARIRIQDEYGIPISADIFGIAMSSKLDGNNLGQDWETLGLTGTNVLAPMVYPSHYALGTILNGQTFDKPDFYPREVVYNALLLGKPASEAEGYSKIRPYLQAFNASWMPEGTWANYDYDMINAQIKGVYDAGFSEWILWDPRVQYPSGTYDGA